jgi:hypothetical protein
MVGGPLYVRKDPQRSLLKKLYAGSIFIATTILLQIAVIKRGGYSRSDTQVEARKIKERVSMNQFIFPWSPPKISESGANTGRSGLPPMNPTYRI